MEFLPATVDGLRKRFHELYTEFTRQWKKHEHKNELVFLLDELLRQQGIDREEYTILNNTLGSEIADDEEEEEKDGSVEEDKTLIQSTVEYLIQQDKKELLELMREFRKDVGDAFIDIKVIDKDIFCENMWETVSKRVRFWIGKREYLQKKCSVFSAS